MAHESRQRAVQEPRYRAMLTRLREARDDARLTQVEVAKALGRTQAWVSKCESGERRIDPVDLADFAKLYERKIKHFLK